MPDYSKGTIYRITAPGSDKFYIGSTTLPLETRLSGHRTRHLRGDGSCRSSLIVSLPDHKIELLEAYPCATVEELRRREGWHIRQNLDRVVNKAIAGRTPAEYMEENKLRYRERALSWYYNNKERRRAYDEANREKRLAYQRNYYQTVVKSRRATAGVSATADATPLPAGAEVTAAEGGLNPVGVAPGPVAGV